MTVVYPTHTLSAYLDSAWYSLSSRQFGQIYADWGISRNGPIDFMADTGKMIFSLTNADGMFTPGHVSVVSADWKKSAKIKLEIFYDGRTRTWYGRIDSFSFQPDSLNQGASIDVTVVDWMDKASKYNLNYPDILLEQTADEAIQALIDNMPIAPLEQDFSTGITTFPVVFDIVTDFTKFRTEANKILLSELAYMYVRHNGSFGETLVLENRNTRLGATAKTIPVISDDSGFLLMETGDFLLLETGDKILLDETQSFSSVDDAESYETDYGDNVVNDITFRYTPREYRQYTSVLDTCWSSRVAITGTAVNDYARLDSLDPGKTKSYSNKYGWYQDGVGGDVNQRFFADFGLNKCLVSPPYWDISTLATTFDMRDTAFSGSSNITSDLVVNSFTAYKDRVEFSLTNNNAGVGYFSNFLELLPGAARIIVSPDVLVYTENSASILENDRQPLQFDMVYQITSDVGDVFAAQVLAAESSPRIVLDRINYNANRSSYNMSAFMSLDIGDYFPVTNANKNIDANFFVQNMKFTIDPGNIINFSIGVKESYEGISPDTISGLKVWLDASTLALSDGVTVASWTDMSGNANHATQSTGSLKPLFTLSNASINNKSTVKFDATDDYMALTSPFNPSTATIFIVLAKNTSGTTNNVILADTDTSYNYIHYGSDWYSPSGSASVTSAMIAGTFYLHSIVMGETLVNRYSNQVNLDGVGEAMTNPAQFEYIGLPSFICNCEIAEIIIFDSALLDTDRAGVEYYLKNKYRL